MFQLYAEYECFAYNCHEVEKVSPGSQTDMLRETQGELPRHSDEFSGRFFERPARTRSMLSIRVRVSPALGA